MTAPILDAIKVLRYTLAPALSAGGARVRWLVDDDPNGTLPVVIFQSQDRGGQQAPYVGAVGWRGTVLIKAIAASQSAAEDALEAALAGLTSLNAPMGYRFSARPLRPEVINPTEGVWFAAYRYECTIERT